MNAALLEWIEAMVQWLVTPAPLDLTRLDAPIKHIPL